MLEQHAGNWLGIDYGERLVGLAMAHPMTGSARPLKPISNTGRAGLEPAFDKIVADWRPERIVVGLPLAGDGSETAMSRRVRSFASWLEQRFEPVDVQLHDERMSSETAASQFAERRRQGRARRRDAARLDSMAAALILDSWMRDHGIT